MTEPTTEAPRAVITDKGVTISNTPYDPEYVEMLKEEIPARGRRYNPVTRAWSVTPLFMQDALYIATASFPDLVVEDLRPKARPKARAEASATWAQAMFAAVPEHLHEATYRALLKALHPDIGGDTMAVRDLIAAYKQRSAAS